MAKFLACFVVTVLAAFVLASDVANSTPTRVLQNVHVLTRNRQRPGATVKTAHADPEVRNDAVPDVEANPTALNGSLTRRTESANLFQSTYSGSGSGSGFGFKLSRFLRAIQAFLRIVNRRAGNNASNTTT